MQDYEDHFIAYDAYNTDAAGHDEDLDEGRDQDQDLDEDQDIDQLQNQGQFEVTFGCDSTIYDSNYIYNPQDPTSAKYDSNYNIYNPGALNFNQVLMQHNNPMSQDLEIAYADVEYEENVRFYSL
jgi:hypothetical protein